MKSIKRANLSAGMLLNNQDFINIRTFSHHLNVLKTHPHRAGPFFFTINLKTVHQVSILQNTVYIGSLIIWKIRIEHTAEWL